MDDIGDMSVTCTGHDCDDCADARLLHIHLLAQVADVTALRASAAMLWPEDGELQLRQWARAAAPGATTCIGMYRITRTADDRLTLHVEGPRGSTTTMEGARAGLQAAGWIALDAGRLRGVA